MSFLAQQGAKYPGKTVTVIPASALVTKLDSLKDADTVIEGRVLLQWDSSSGNGYVKLCAAGDKPHGRIKALETDRDNDYSITMEMFGYEDANSVYHGLGVLVELEYTGTIALGNGVDVSGDDGLLVDGDATASGTCGTVVYKDTSSGKVTVLI